MKNQHPGANYYIPAPPAPLVHNPLYIAANNQILGHVQFQYGGNVVVGNIRILGQVHLAGNIDQDEASSSDNEDFAPYHSCNLM